MNSPICLSKRCEDNKTVYLSPQDKDFEQYINNNFCKKFLSYYNTAPFSDVEIITTCVSSSDKVVTSLKNVYITAWKGNFILGGSPDYLSFLYDCGLGNRNSQGFGLFEVVE